MASDILSGWLGTIGTHIVLWTVLAVSVVVATGLSFVRVGRVLFKAASWTLELTGTGVKRFKERRKARPVIERKRVSLRRPGARPAIITPREKTKKKERAVQESFEFLSPGGAFKLPPLTLLDTVPEKKGSIDRETLLTNSKILERKLQDFDVEGSVVEVRAGPIVTMYEFEPAPGIKVGKIMNLSDDLALAMRAMSVRILAPVPGKAVVGIEIPNQTREKIVLKEILESKAFLKSHSKLTLALGKDISGASYVADLMKMPHLLVAGATGAGKSVAVNAMILCILFKATPEDVRFIMIDPKMLELSPYEGIPHLLTPVITEPKRAIAVLRSVVTEMGKRYKLMAEKGAKNIERYNSIVEGEEGGEGERGEENEGEHKRLPYIVVVIDELADLMMASGKDVEESLVRLSQMARAAGIHLLVATQRPSVDVITGLIKTNLPARISFQVPSRTDSRTILDAIGAETLLGEGDLLFLPPGSTKLQRIHGPYVSEVEIKKVTDFLKKQGKPAYHKEITAAKTADRAHVEEELGEEFIARYDEAVEIARKLDIISTSYIQRRLRVGYNTAARIIEKMEGEGIVGPAQGSRPREVLKGSKEG
jgi:S-DNA-T family DNA segregation ATPase FtsK/SpoIIIE